MNFFVAIFIVALISGCSSPHPSHPAPVITPKVKLLTDQLIQSKKGDFDWLWSDWFKPQMNFKVNYTNSDGTPIDLIAVGISTTENDIIVTQNAILSDFSKFCQASGGGFNQITEEYGYTSKCTTYGEELSILRLERANYTKIGNDRVLKISMSTKKEIAAKEYKSLSSPQYLSFEQLTFRINKFKDNDPDLLIPKAKKVLAEVIASKKKEEEEKAIKRAILLKRKENRQIGDLICFRGTAAGTARGVQGVRGTLVIRGFVEGINVSTKRLQIRISGLVFSDGTARETLDDITGFRGIPMLKVGNIIWDNAIDWDDC